MSGRKTTIRNRSMWEMHGMPSAKTKTAYRDARSERYQHLTQPTTQPKHNPLP